MVDTLQRPSLLGRFKKRLAKAVHRLRFRASLRHLHGPGKRTAAPDDVVLVALVRDGAYYLDAFLDHYRSLGIRQFVFFDNGSTDGTLERIKREPGSVILQSTLPWGQFENDFRNHAVQRYAKDRWCLIVDMDEIFDFEGRNKIGLTGLIQYLGEQGYSGMMAQMLEMFPKAPLKQVADLTYPQALEQFRYCDISSIRSHDYTDAATGLSYFLQQNSGQPPLPQILFGGIRGKVFGEGCCLSKHPLIFVGPDVDPARHPHASTGLNLAPMTAVIQHYKFANDTLARDRQTLAAGSISHGEDRLRLTRMEQAPDLSLWSEEAQAYPGITALQTQGFLQADPAYSTHLHSANPVLGKAADRD